MAGLAKLWNRVKNFKLNIMNYDVFLQICAALLVFVHLTLMIALGVEGATFLSRLNILSILIYVVAVQVCTPTRNGGVSFLLHIITSMSYHLCYLC